MLSELDEQLISVIDKAGSFLHLENFSNVVKGQLELKNKEIECLKRSNNQLSGTLELFLKFIQKVYPHIIFLHKDLIDSIEKILDLNKELN